MGGEGFVFKMKTIGTVSGMRVVDGPRVLKMACGENPKRVYGSKVNQLESLLNSKGSHSCQSSRRCLGNA